MHRIDAAVRDGLVFDVADHGPLDGPAVVALHGFPEAGSTWDEVVPRLVTAGFRVLVPDQRGYSPRARPRGRAAYRIEALAADVLAVADSAGVERFHLLGHDWGGAVAWHLAATRPDRVRTLVVLSTPHPQALAESLVRSPQAVRSAYVAAFQVPLLPERLLSAFDGRPTRWALEATGAGSKAARAGAAQLGTAEAARGALGWYRALLSTPPDGGGRAGDGEPAPGTGHVEGDPPGLVRVPTTFLWSTDDPALGRTAAERTGRWVAADYRFEVLDGVSHWIPHEVPDLVADRVEALAAAHAA